MQPLRDSKPVSAAEGAEVAAESRIFPLPSASRLDLKSIAEPPPFHQADIAAGGAALRSATITGASRAAPASENPAETSNATGADT